ncbi:peroxynitrite isomerase THAP4-like [Cylas formicarius]|uniref:peroxynitrite isomerase THAP4-like n=1 Tax=Cylas formicarius TaxID=197179 RepID=UPI00295872D9|nr:peroxynitrite isomerase THAP4-like [Cylas formicarius]
MPGNVKTHEILKNLRWLVGKWKSVSAVANYPTMKSPVEYTETLEFRSEGQPLLNYFSVTRNPKNGSVMHLECGYLRIDDDEKTVAFLTAQNFGLSTLEEGYVEDKTMIVGTACIGIMKFAKQTVLGLHRCYRLNENGRLEYCAMMETPQTPPVVHITAVYEKSQCDAAEPDKH